jgi:hypothetical protein
MLSVSKASKRILLEIHGSCEKKTSICELGHQDLVLCSSLEIFHLPRIHPTVHYLQRALAPYPANKFFDTIKEFSLSLSLSLSLSHTHTHARAHPQKPLHWLSLALQNLRNPSPGKKLFVFSMYNNKASMAATKLFFFSMHK